MATFIMYSFWNERIEIVPDIKIEPNCVWVRGTGKTRIKRSIFHTVTGWPIQGVSHRGSKYEWAIAF